MGMSIDKKCYLYGSCKCQTAGCVVRPNNGCPVYRYFKDLIVKDQYEAKLKADMVAILEDLKQEIDMMPKYFPYTDHTIWFIDGDVFKLIQQKIDKLKGDSE